MEAKSAKQGCEHYKNSVCIVGMCDSHRVSSLKVCQKDEDIEKTPNLTICGRIAEEH